MPTIIIFGASRGLGLAFTKLAMIQGHKVHAMVRSSQAASCAHSVPMWYRGTPSIERR